MTSRDQLPKSAYYRSLDGLRALAVLIVLLAHAGAPYPLSGGAGVDIFFVLSGFLITTILAGEHRRRGAISLRNFYARRLLRLLPCLMLTCGLFASIVLLTTGELPRTQLLLALTYTANWARAAFDVDMMSLGHSWSLAIEEQFYLLWPFVVMLVERSTRTPARKGALLLALALALAGYRAAMTGTLPAERIYFGLDTHMDGLVLGSALAYFARALQADQGIGETASRWLSRGAPLALAAIALVMGTLTWADERMGRFGFLAVAVASAVVIADLVLSRHSLLQRPLAMRLPVYIGRISYGIYLLHYPLFHLLDRAWPELHITVMLPVKFVLVVTAAALSFHLLEQPFLRLKSLFAEPARRPVAEAPFATFTAAPFTTGRCPQPCDTTARDRTRCRGSRTG